MWAGEGDADQIIEARSLQQISDVAALEKVVQQVVTDNPEQAGQYRGGKQKLLGFFVGQVMQATGERPTRLKSTNCCVPGLMPMKTDRLRRFTLEHQGIRGSLVRIPETWRCIQEARCIRPGGRPHPWARGRGGSADWQEPQI